MSAAAGRPLRTNIGVGSPGRGSSGRQGSGWPCTVTKSEEVIINWDSWGHSYLTVKDESIGIVKDGLLRKRLPRIDQRQEAQQLLVPGGCGEMIYGGFCPFSRLLGELV